MGVLTAENNDGVVAERLLAVETGTNPFSDENLKHLAGRHVVSPETNLKGRLVGSAKRRARELLEGGFGEGLATCRTDVSQLGHDADERRLRRLSVGAEASQRRVVAEEECTSRRGNLETFGDLESLSELVRVLGEPEVGAGRYGGDGHHRRERKTLVSIAGTVEVEKCSADVETEQTHYILCKQMSKIATTSNLNKITKSKRK